MKETIFKVKKLLLSVPNNFGFDLIKSSENYLNESWCSPIELIYKTHKPFILITVPMTDIRFLSAHGYKAGEKIDAPFITTIKEYASGAVKNYNDSILSQFYADFQPKSISEYLYLGEAENKILNELPASGMFYPWQDINPISNIKQRSLQVKFDNKEHNLKLNISGGDPFYGPVSREKGELEYSRLINVYDSIRENGFKVNPKSKKNIDAIILENNSEYRYFITSGQHRIAALSCLGYESVTMQVYKGLIVRRSEVDFWPGVIRGYFTKLEALMIFDMIFTGRE